MIVVMVTLSDALVQTVPRDVGAIAAEVDSKFMSACVHAHKPARKACCA
jgi:hypothetical protein